MTDKTSPELEVREEREKEAAEGEPLNTQRRDVVTLNESLYVNLSAYARDTLGIVQGDTVKVHTHRDRVEIVVVQDDG